MKSQMNRSEYLCNLRTSIKAQYGSDSIHLRSEPVNLDAYDNLQWEGQVELFLIKDSGLQCYAWSRTLEDVANSVKLVLHKGHINSPERAVLMNMVAESA